MWGSTVLVERAVDFLIPDAASSTDFDDLLRRHLGVDSRFPDGPLDELLALARQHAPSPAGEPDPMLDALKHVGWTIGAFPWRWDEKEGEGWSVRVRAHGKEDPDARRVVIQIRRTVFKRMFELTAVIPHAGVIDARRLPTDGYGLTSLDGRVSLIKVISTDELEPTRLRGVLQAMADRAAEVRALLADPG
jgi:hypothetical protein